MAKEISFKETIKTQTYGYTDDMRKYIISPDDGFDALIERRYIEIRKAGFNDVSDIAKNTGLLEEDIAHI